MVSERACGVKRRWRIRRAMISMPAEGRMFRFGYRLDEDPAPW